MDCWCFPRADSAPPVSPNLDSALLFTELSIAPSNRILLLIAIINAPYLSLGVHPLHLSHHFLRHGSVNHKVSFNLATDYSVCLSTAHLDDSCTELSSIYNSRFSMVMLSGLEPTTSALSERHSNQLSYSTIMVVHLRIELRLRA